MSTKPFIEGESPGVLCGIYGCAAILVAPHVEEDEPTLLCRRCGNVL